MKRLTAIALAVLATSSVCLTSACTARSSDPTKGVTALPPDAAGLQTTFERLARNRGYGRISTVHVDPSRGIDVGLLADTATASEHVVSLAWPAGQISEQDGTLAAPVPALPVMDVVPIGDLYSRARNAMPGCAAVELDWSVTHDGRQLAAGICAGDTAHPGFVSVDGKTVDVLGDPYTAAGVASRLDLVKLLGISSIYRFSIIQGSMAVEVADASATLSDGTTCQWTLHLSTWIGTACAGGTSPTPGTAGTAPIGTSTLDPAAVGSLVAQVKAAADAAGGLAGGLIVFEADPGANQPVLRAETQAGSVVFGLDGRRLS